MMTKTCVAGGLLVVVSTIAWGQTRPDPLKPYLADLSPGPIAAHEILGLDKSLVSNIQSPKDLVAAVSSTSGDGARPGFGLSISPARTAIEPFSLSLDNYVNARNYFSRIWGGTSFSYAHNTRTLAGSSVDFAQDAIAMNVSYYLNADDDPVVASYRGVVDCTKDKEKTAEFNAEVIRLRKLADEAARARKGSALTDEEIDKLENEIRADLAGPIRFLAVANKETRLCAKSAYDRALQKWNASQLGFTLGQGWIKGAGAERVSLGLHVSLAGAIGFREMENSLFHVTLRRVAREVVPSTIATGDRRFESSSLAALRYTYGYGGGRNTFVLAEISNAKRTVQTQANTAFKYAVGLDHKLSDGIWLEFRLGRSSTVDGTKLDNKALLNLKFSPESRLAKLTTN